MQKDNRPAIVIPSCDDYADAWEPFFFCFERFWPDCPYDIYLITNYLSCTRSNVHTIPVGEDVDYSANLLKALSQISHEYVLIWLEDLLLCRTMEPKFGDLIQQAIDRNVGYLKLWQYEQAKGASSQSPFIEIKKGRRFRLSLKPALWQKTTLTKLIVSGESPHELERKGSRRSDKLDDEFLGLSTAAECRIGCINLIYRGKYEPGALHQLSVWQYPEMLNKRPKRSKYKSYIELKLFAKILQYLKKWRLGNF